MQIIILILENLIFISLFYLDVIIVFGELSLNKKINIILNYKRNLNIDILKIYY